MTDEEKENIKYRLSDIGKQVGELALEYILDLEKENAEQKVQIEKMKCCGNCIHFMYGYCMTDKTCHINNEYKEWKLAE